MLTKLDAILKYQSLDLWL